MFLNKLKKKVAASPLDSPCDRPVTYPGDSKHHS